MTATKPPTAAELAEQAARDAESLSTFRRVEAQHHLDIATLEAELATLREKLDKAVLVEAYRLKLKIASDELRLDTAHDELAKLASIIAAAQAAVDAPRRETRPVQDLETR